MWPSIARKSLRTTTSHNSPTTTNNKCPTLAAQRVGRLYDLRSFIHTCFSEALPQLQIQRFTGAFRGCRNTFSSQLRTSAIRVVFKAVSVGHTHKLTAAAVFVLTCQCLFEALRSHMRACIHYRGTSVGVTRFPCSPWGPVLGVKPLSQSLGMKFSCWGPPWVHLLSQSLGMKLPWSLLFWG